MSNLNPNTEAKQLADYYRGDREGFALAAEDACVEFDADHDTGKVIYLFADGSAVALYSDGRRKFLQPRPDRVAELTH